MTGDAALPGSCVRVRRVRLLQGCCVDSRQRMRRRTSLSWLRYSPAVAMRFEGSCSGLAGWDVQGPQVQTAHVYELLWGLGMPAGRPEGELCGFGFVGFVDDWQGRVRCSDSVVRRRTAMPAVSSELLC